MQAVLLVGGEGTRLRPLTYNTVKAMVPVLNRPFLEHMILYLRSHGINEIVITVCYLPDHIERYFGDGTGLGVRLVYVMEETPLGTAGAVKNAERYLEDTFLVFNGDIFTQIDLTAMVAFHKEKKSKATIALTPVDDPTSYGVVETEADWRLRRFLEKPSRDEVTTNLINAGIYVLDRQVLQDAPAGTHLMFEHHLFPGLVARGEPVYGYRSEAYWIDMGTPAKYLQLHRDLLRQKTAAGLFVPAGRAQPDGVAQSAIDPTASMEGPVLIGSGTTVGPHVRIQGPTAIGERCVIAEGATIESAVLWRDVSVGRQATLKGCVVGDGCRIGDNGAIDEGCVVGDGVSLAQGAHLPPDSRIDPGTEVTSIRP
jgi:mannose-1-phosphate guanylyltransferase